MHGVNHDRTTKGRLRWPGRLAPVPALAVVLFLALTLPGCAGLLESEAPAASHWWLEPANPDAAALRAVADRGADGLVLDLSVVPGLDTDRILNLDGNARLNHYAGAHWPDHLPEVLASVLARSLESGGALRVRQGERAGERECLLRLETRAFYGWVEAGVTDRVEVAFAGRLDCAGEAWTLSTRNDRVVSDNRLSAIVAAFQAALDGATDDLVAQFPDP